MAAFVRTKRVGDKEYRQLVENYRENGHHRQRVLAHLGKHATLEEAIEAARAKVEAADTEKLSEAMKERRAYRETIHRRYGSALERYHGGEIPHSSDVYERARLHSGYSIYGHKEVEVPEEVEEYRRAFGDVREGEGVTYYGSRVIDGGLYSFCRYLEAYEYCCERAERLEYTYARRKARLEKLEAVLDSGD